MVIALRPLGRTGLHVSTVSAGAWGLGGGNDWGRVEEKEAVDALARTLDLGVNLIDVSPVYGDGVAEQRVSQALKGRRGQVILAGKCGLVRSGTWNVHDLTPASIRTQLEGSLTRLQTDYIDLYQLHWPDPAVPLADSLGELLRLQEAGKIRFIGVCNFSTPELSAAAEICEITAVQNLRNVLSVEEETVLEVCRHRRISFIGYGTLAGGILSGKYKQEPNLRRCDARKYFYKCYTGAEFERAQRAAQRLNKVAQKYAVRPCVVAAAWSTNRPEVSAALCGVKTLAQAQENFGGPELNLTTADITFLTNESN